MITDVEEYFLKGCGRCARFATPECSTRIWHPGLARLRVLCLLAGLTETVKWGHPCYVHAGRNIAVIGAFRGDFRLSFFDAALLKDPHGVLEQAGPNTRAATLIRFTHAEQVESMGPVIMSYLSEAMRYAEAGIKPSRDTSAPDLPDILIEALDADPDLAQAFHALTPGRQRSYVLALASAKKPETQSARIVKFRSHILAGKGATER